MFAKLQKTIFVIEFIVKCHAAFALLSHIALRTDRESGDCLIPGFRAVGFNSEQAYRTAKKQLEAAGLVTFTGTNKGTRAKIISTRIYDLNLELNNEQTNDQRTDRQRSKNEQGNRQITSASFNKKKEVKKKRNKEIYFDSFWELYPLKKAKGAAEKAWEKIPEDLKPEILKKLQEQIQAGMLKRDTFTKHPSTWINQECWSDEIFQPESNNPDATISNWE